MLRRTVIGKQSYPQIMIELGLRTSFVQSMNLIHDQQSATPDWLFAYYTTYFLIWLTFYFSLLKINLIVSILYIRYEDKRWVSKDGIQKLPSSAQDEKFTPHHHRAEDVNGNGHVTKSTHVSEERKNVLPSHRKESIATSRINLPAPPRGSEPVILLLTSPVFFGFP